MALEGGSCERQHRRKVTIGGLPENIGVRSSLQPMLSYLWLLHAHWIRMIRGQVSIGTSLSIPPKTTISLLGGLLYFNYPLPLEVIAFGVRCQLIFKPV